jgi:hypothetical protein
MTEHIMTPITACEATRHTVIVLCAFSTAQLPKKGLLPYTALNACASGHKRLHVILLMPYGVILLMPYGVILLLLPYDRAETTQDVCGTCSNLDALTPA